MNVIVSIVLNTWLQFAYIVCLFIYQRRGGSNLYAYGMHAADISRTPNIYPRAPTVEADLSCLQVANEPYTKAYALVQFALIRCCRVMLLKCCSKVYFQYIAFAQTLLNIVYHAHW